MSILLLVSGGLAPAAAQNPADGVVERSDLTPAQFAARLAAGEIVPVAESSAPAASREPRPRVPVPPRFTRLSLDDGLSRKDVRAMAQDPQGFLWFGTAQGGLNRYDGREFKVYLHDRQDPRSLSNNTVWSLFVDRDGTLWVGTAQGLDRYDRETDTFTRFRHDPDDPRSLPHDDVASFCQSRDGVLWVGTRHGLARLDPDGASFTNYLNSADQPGKFQHGSMRRIMEDPTTGHLWVSSPRWVQVFDPKTGMVVALHGKDAGLPAGQIVEYSRIIKDRDGVIWVATTDGLKRFLPETGSFEHHRHDPQNPSSLADNRVTDIHEDRKGRFWVATTSGLDLFDRKTGIFTHHGKIRGDPGSLGGRHCSAILEDRDDALWIATADGGVSRLADDAKAFVPYPLRLDDTPDQDAATAVCADREGRLWVGTADGLHRLDDGEWARFRHDPFRPDSLVDNRVSALALDRRGGLWIGTRGGLCLWDGAGFRSYRRPGPPPDPGAAPSPDLPPANDITSLLADDQDGLWITSPDWLARFDGTSFVHHPAVSAPGILTGLKPTLGSIDRHGILWLGSGQHGLLRFDPATGVFTRHLLDPERFGTVTDNKVYAVHADADGAVWAGGTKGLHRFDVATRSFTRSYSTVDGMPADAVFQLLGDDLGRLWTGTASGLSCFDPGRGTFRTYTRSDGLPSSSISGQPGKAPDGRLLFCSESGAFAFYPDQLADNPRLPTVVITGFELFNKPVPIAAEGSPLPSAINVLDRLTLTHRQSVLTFKFVAPAYTAPEKIRYAYKLEGFDQEWNHTDAGRRFATYTRLAPGDYVFRVKAANNDGLWNERATALALRILPPWWAAWWFLGSTGALLLGLAVGGYRWRVLRLERRGLKLDLLVQERTVALVERTRQLELAKKKADLANQAKSAFLANMSHELRTPLNAILGYAQILLRRGETLDERQSGGLHIIHESGEHLLTLINDILDLSRVEADRLELHPEDFNLPSFLRVVADIVRVKAEQKSLLFVCEFAPDLPAAVRADEKRLRQVLLNLLGNAVKFTDRGRVTFRVAPAATRDPAPGVSMGTIHFEVEDTGIGMTEAQRARLFEPFEQVGDIRRREGGAGLGLAISRRLVRLMGGDIEVASSPHEGSRFGFRLELPVSRVAVAEPEPGPVVTAYEGSRKRVLVVDDVAANRALLLDALSDLGFSVAEAPDGLSGLGRAAALAPDLIVMDMTMPVLDGLEATRRLRAIPALAKVPVIMVSASAAEEDRARAADAGASAFLPKPVELAALLKVIGERLELTWIHRPVATEETREPRGHATTTPLPPEEAKTLHELALRGDMRRLRAHADHLASLGEAHRPLADKLRRMADAYRSKAILALVKQHLPPPAA